MSLAAKRRRTCAGRSCSTVVRASQSRRPAHLPHVLLERFLWLTLPTQKGRFFSSWQLRFAAFRAPVLSPPLEFDQRSDQLFGSSKPLEILASLFSPPKYNRLAPPTLFLGPRSLVTERMLSRLLQLAAIAGLASSVFAQSCPNGKDIGNGVHGALSLTLNAAQLRAGAGGSIHLARPLISDDMPPRPSVPGNIPANPYEPLQHRLAYAGPTGMTVSWNTFSLIDQPTVWCKSCRNRCRLNQDAHVLATQTA